MFLKIPGLIELPKALELSNLIQPAKLATSCDNIEGFEDIIAAGMGRVEKDKPSTERILRHGSSKALSYLDTLDALADYPLPDAVICAVSLTQQGVHKGDSGN